MVIDGTDLTTIGIYVIQGYSTPILPPTQDRVISVPGKNGAYDFGSNLGVRTFNYNCVISANTRTDLMSKARTLTELLIDKFGKPKLVSLETNDWPNAFYKVKLTVGIDMERVVQTGQFTIQFTATDIYLYSKNQFTHSENIAEPDTTHIFTLGGDVINYPIITIKGTNSTGSFQVTLNGQSFTYSGSITSNDTVTIDCDKFAVYKNGVRDLVHFSGKFPYVNPLTNNILFHVNSNAVLSELTIVGRERWLV